MIELDIVHVVSMGSKTNTKSKKGRTSFPYRSVFAKRGMQVQSRIEVSSTSEGLDVKHEKTAFSVGNFVGEYSWTD